MLLTSHRQSNSVFEGSLASVSLRGDAAASVVARKSGPSPCSAGAGTVSRLPLTAGAPTERPAPGETRGRRDWPRGRSGMLPAAPGGGNILVAEELGSSKEESFEET